MNVGPQMLPTPEHAFPPMRSFQEEEADRERTRVFVGDGGFFLAVPGLLSLEKVRVASIEIPMERIDEVLLDSTGQRKGYMRIPLLSLDKAEDGVPVLRRSVCSNDGIWQQGQLFYVTGEWDPDVEPETPELFTPAEKLAAAAMTKRGPGRPPKVPAGVNG